MTFGQRIRQLRLSKGLSLRKLAPLVGVGFAYLCRVENERLNFGDYPSEALIHKLADVLDGDEDELLLLAQKVPPLIKKRLFERPEAFRQLAAMTDKELDKMLGVGTEG